MQANFVACVPQCWIYLCWFIFGGSECRRVAGWPSERESKFWAGKPQGETLWYNVGWSPDDFLLSFCSSLDFLLQRSRRKPFSWTSLKIISVSGISKLWYNPVKYSLLPQNLRMVLGSLNGWKKSKEEFCFMYYENYTWNSSFSVHQQSFIGTQPHSKLICCLLLLSC